MERHSRSPDSPKGRHRNRHNARRKSRSWSRSRSRERSRERRRRSRSRSRSRDRIYNRRVSPDLYKDLIDQDYQTDRERYHRSERRSRERDRDRRDKDKHYRRGHSSDSYLDDINSNDSFDSDHVNNSEYYRNQVPTNVIVILGIAKHLTEGEIFSEFINSGFEPLSIQLIRRKSGGSRGFAFIVFNSKEEATRWMEYKQGVIMIQDQYRAIMQYAYERVSSGTQKLTADWYCVKCGVFNFRRREHCFKCYASRGESEKGGEGSDEISNILTKKIMLRNLDVLTNEECVLTMMQEVVPNLVAKISKILICRDPLTSTSRGICYLSFDNLVDSMNTHNALKTLEPTLKIDNREVRVSYCVDAENKQMTKSNDQNVSAHSSSSSSSNSAINTHRYTLADVPRLAEYSASIYASTPAEHTHYYTYYTDYYVKQITSGQFANLPTLSQIGETANSGAYVALKAILRKQKKKYKSGNAYAPVSAATTPVAIRPPIVPTGNDKKKYPTPDVTQYQYDETSGYYYDRTTGLYYDPNSQYYYNSELAIYLYWDQENKTYALAPTTSTTTSEKSTTTTTTTTTTTATTTTTGTSLAATTVATTTTTTTTTSKPISTENAILNTENKGLEKVDEYYYNYINNDEKQFDEKKDPMKRDTGNKTDKVKVAKKIVKDMEKWAKQLNQKKDLNMLPAPVIPQPPIISNNNSIKDDGYNNMSKYSRNIGYADVGFSLLENKERTKMSMDVSQYSMNNTTVKKLVSGYGSDSDNEQNDNHHSHSSSIAQQKPSTLSAADTTFASSSSRVTSSSSVFSEKDYVDFDKLTCLLCKRAFQSLDILNKHLKISNLHKDNLQKFKGFNNNNNDINNMVSTATSSLLMAANNQSYRDRAKERRLKYGESDPPPPNRSRERFEKELEKHTAALQAQSSTKLASVPIGENNVGNRLLQKMGWSEGQGLGRSNQGRTNIIEAESRAPAAGLGTKSTNFGPGDDYKSYIKKMMKSRYEQVD